MTANRRMKRCLMAAIVSLLCVTSPVTSFCASVATTAMTTKSSANSMLVLQAGATLEKKNSSKSQLPPVLEYIANERAEFHMNLGRAMDVLRRDMPDILKRQPDFSIYHDDLNVIDPSGVRLTGLKNYKSAIAFMQTFLNFWFTPDSGLQYRMVYDFCRSSIRISWHAVLFPKMFPLSRPLHVDGISYYKLDVDSGKIIEHKIETILINNTPVAPPFGIFSLLQQDAFGMRPVGVPAGALGAGSAGAFQ